MSSSPEPMAGKGDWRRWAKPRRSSVAEHSHAIVDAIIDWLPSAPDGAVLAFLPLPDEIDLTALAARTDRPLAVTRTPAEGPLTIHGWEAPRERHPYGFEQPGPDAPHFPASLLGVVLVPGLVFDRRGARLGRGAGYYDRLLASLGSGMRRVGVVPEFLVVDALPTEPHDVSMTHLATELGVVAVDR